MNFSIIYLHFFFHKYFIKKTIQNLNQILYLKTYYKHKFQY